MDPSTNKYEIHAAARDGRSKFAWGVLYAMTVELIRH
jgi:hypothetical protein